MDILVTRKELDESWKKYEMDNPGQIIPWGDVVAQVQLQKVVEWLRQNNHGGEVLIINAEKWNALVSEAGLK